MVNPLYTLRALHQILSDKKSEYKPNHVVNKIVPEPGGFRVITNNDVFTSGQIILAAGNGNSKLGGGVGLSIPVAPERGHVVVTERVPSLFTHVLGQIRQTDEGSVMLGATKEKVGFDDGIKLKMTAQIVSRAVRKVPALKDLRMIRSWSALRVMSPDGFPIYQESPDYPGAYVITCHSGVTLAAVHALRLAPNLLDPNFNDKFSAFSSRRFDVSKTN